MWPERVKIQIPGVILFLLLQNLSTRYELFRGSDTATAAAAMSQEPGECSPGQRDWFRERGYSVEQQNSLCRSGLAFLQNAVTISFRAGLQRRMVAELVTMPISTPANVPLKISSVTYCGVKTAENSITAVVLLSDRNAVTTARLSEQDCALATATISQQHPDALGAAKLTLRWVPWKLQLNLTEGNLTLPGTTTPVMLQPFMISELPTDVVNVELPDGVLAYRAAIFFSSSLTIAVLPLSAADTSLPTAATVVPESERLPDGRDLNTVIRIPEKAIQNVTRSLNRAHYTFPTGDPRIGDLTLSNFSWGRSGDVPQVRAAITDASGRRFNASLSLGTSSFGWLALNAATLEAVEMPCTGNPLAQAQCRAQNIALRALAPVAAAIFVERYSLVPIRPFTTQQVFPLTIAGRKLLFQGLLYSFVAIPHSADLIMYCQFGIGDVP
jgi:hypothetical protein